MIKLTLAHRERLMKLGFDLTQPSTWLNPPKPVIVTSPYNIDTWSKALVRFTYKDGGAIYHCADGASTYNAKHHVYGGWELFGVPHRIGGYAKENEYWVCGVKLTDEEYFVFLRMYGKDKEKAIAMIINEVIKNG